MNSLLRKIGFFTAFIVPSLVISGFYIRGYGNFLALGFSFIVLPLIDQLVGIDPTNVSRQEAKVLGTAFYYRFVTYLWTYFQFFFIFWACSAVVSGGLRGFSDWMGFTIGVALVTGGIGITVAHELGHKNSLVERFYSRALLMTVGYMHFYIEHNRGHHVNVATPSDPATARKDENFYRFWFRSVSCGYLHSWQLENERVTKNDLPWFRNQMVWYTLLPPLFIAVVTLAFSLIEGRFTWEVPLLLFSQAILAFTLLELVNYVEHYGMERKELSPGRFERVSPLHSWNASHIISNFFLFQLQRHSDHHIAAHKRYQILDHYESSPQLPHGYPTMILLAAVPPLWFVLMNQRLDYWKKQASSETSTG